MGGSELDVLCGELGTGLEMSGDLDTGLGTSGDLDTGLGTSGDLDNATSGSLVSFGSGETASEVVVLPLNKAGDGVFDLK